MGKECCVNKEKYAQKYEPINTVLDFPVEDWNLYLIESHFENAKHPLSPNVNKYRYQNTLNMKLNQMSEEQQNDYHECMRLGQVWWHKFEQIRKYPNERQCVKFDRIS